MKRRLVIIVIFVVVILAAGWFWLGRGDKEPDYRTVMAERTTVKQDVTFTGRLDTKQSAVLAFEIGGTVMEVLAELGQRVSAGDALVKIDDRLASLELAKARADQDAAQEQKKLAWDAAVADWDKVKVENVRTVEKARQAVRDAKRELDQQRQVHAQTDGESGDSSTTDTAVLTLRVKESAYHAAQQALLVAEKTAKKTNQVKQDAAEAAESEYISTIQRSGSVAGLSSLEASEELAAVRLSKTTMTAPFDGAITLIDVDEGEYATAGATVVKVEGTDDLELMADVPETDAAKLASGSMATITFDAYGSAELWQAEVVSVAPAATIIEGIPTFEVKLRLISSDPKFKPGLTANIVVHSAQRDNVVAIPRRAVVTTEGRQFVKIVEGEEIQEVAVSTGLLGSDGRIEITSGLSGGEKVLINGVTEE